VESSFEPQFIPWRFYLAIGLIVFIVLGLIARIFDLAILDQPFLQKQGNDRILRLVNTPAFRGMIVDRNGFPLAVSTSVYSAWMNPQEFQPQKKSLAELASLLEIKPKEILQIYQHNHSKKREFVYIKRALAPEIAKQVKALSLTGIYLQQDYRRYYPEGEVTAHVIGLTNVDDRGQEGLELAYNDWLAGEAGKKWVIKDRIGRIISDVEKVQEQKAGHDLMLSIDRRIQYLAYRELLTGVLANEAESGSAIVLDIKTGEILAMVNQPSFNPNSRPMHTNGNLRNRAVTDLFEPGSTIKPFSIASAMKSGHIRPDTVVDTTPGWMRVGHNIVKDEHNNGFLTVTEILKKSSNVGVTKIILNQPPNQVWDILNRLGFGEVTGVNFPGEQNGVLVRQDPWGAFMLATLSWGYGLSVTTLQLAHAYATLANDGVKLPLSLLRVNKSPAGEQVIDPKITHQILQMLESVLEKGGTAEAARVPGYRVAGKTGTSRTAGEGGYQKHNFTSSFVGIAPLTHPRFVVAVVIHDPQGKHYHGGAVSGPVFSKIMEGTLRIFDVSPDEAA
jgi:cell division protein FtsI (penicillin-binding protein 3)